MNQRKKVKEAMKSGKTGADSMKLSKKTIRLLITMVDDIADYYDDKWHMPCPMQLPSFCTDETKKLLNCNYDEEGLCWRETGIKKCWSKLFVKLLEEEK